MEITSSANRLQALVAPQNDEQLIYGLKKLSHTSKPPLDLRNPENPVQTIARNRRLEIWNWVAPNAEVAGVQGGPHLGLFWYSRGHEEGIFIASLFSDLRYDGVDFGNYIVPDGDPELFWPDVQQQVPQWKDLSADGVLSGRVIFDKAALVFVVILPASEVENSTLIARIREEFYLPGDRSRVLAFT